MMLRVLGQLSNDLSSAVALLRRRYLYMFRSGKVGNSEGVINDTVRMGRLQCEISFRYKSLSDIRVVDQIFQHREYALAETEPHGNALRHYYDSVLATGKKPLILDAGANIGASSLYFSCAYPESVVVAVEPERENCALLKRNAQGKPIHVIEAAIGAEPGTIYLQDPGLSDWGFRTAESGDYAVPLVSPDCILDRFSEDRFTPLLFKIDIEGFEEQLFSGNLQWVDKFPMIAIELHDWMLPGRGSSRSFLRAMSSLDFDFLHAGENVFCFNNRLLSIGQRRLKRSTGSLPRLTARPGEPSVIASRSSADTAR